MKKLILGVLQHVIMESMTRTPEDGICRVEEIVLNSDFARAYREAIGEKTAIPTTAASSSVPKPLLEPSQSIIAKLDDVWLIEDTTAYQPMVLGRLVTETERRMRK